MHWRKRVNDRRLSASKISENTESDGFDRGRSVFFCPESFRLMRGWNRVEFPNRDRMLLRTSGDGLRWPETSTPFEDMKSHSH